MRLIADKKKKQQNGAPLIAEYQRRRHFLSCQQEGKQSNEVTLRSGCLASEGNTHFLIESRYSWKRSVICVEVSLNSRTKCKSLKLFLI